jgi:hypothetical protein
MLKFLYEISLPYFEGIFNMPLNLTRGWRLYAPSEGSRAKDFIAFKNPSPSHGFESANLMSNDKHANHYTTEDDNSPHTFYGDRRWYRM